MLEGVVVALILAQTTPPPLPNACGPTEQVYGRLQQIYGERPGSIYLERHGLSRLVVLRNVGTDTWTLVRDWPERHLADGTIIGARSCIVATGQGVGIYPGNHTNPGDDA